MAKQHREVLARLDPVAVARYQITEVEDGRLEAAQRIIAELKGEAP